MRYLLSFRRPGPRHRSGPGEQLRVCDEAGGRVPAVPGRGCPLGRARRRRGDLHQGPVPGGLPGPGRGHGEGGGGQGEGKVLGTITEDDQPHNWHNIYIKHNNNHHHSLPHDRDQPALVLDNAPAAVSNPAHLPLDQHLAILPSPWW